MEYQSPNKMEVKVSFFGELCVVHYLFKIILKIFIKNKVHHILAFLAVFTTASAFVDKLDRDSSSV